MTDKIREWRDEAEKLQLIDQFPEELRELARSFPLDKLRLCLEARKKSLELSEMMRQSHETFQNELRLRKSQ